MYDIRTDIVRNRLYLFLGDIQPSEIHRATDEIENACDRLAEGFACVSIFPKVDVAVYKEEDRILKTQEIILLHSPSIVIRVVADPTPMERHHLETLSLKYAYPIRYVESLEAAEQILDRQDHPAAL